MAVADKALNELLNYAISLESEEFEVQAIETRYINDSCKKAFEVETKEKTIVDIPLKRFYK